MNNFASQFPTVYMIAGPNGAGKTTFASEFFLTLLIVMFFLWLPSTDLAMARVKNRVVKEGITSLSPLSVVDVLNQDYKTCFNSISHELMLGAYMMPRNFLQ